MTEIMRADLSDLTPDPDNANRGTERGKALLAESLAQLGAGRSILIDRNGVIIAGNKTAAEAQALGMQEVLIVQTDGSQIVAVQRMDLEKGADPRAERLALMDNRVAEADLSWDPSVLARLVNEQPEVVEGLWEGGELEKILAGGEGQAPARAPARRRAARTVAIACPHCGQTFELEELVSLLPK